MSGFLIIIVLAAVAWFWLDSSRARELAIGICKRASEKYGVQFLDESVELKRLGLRWPSEGIRIRRVYQFEFSRDGMQRVTGSLALVGINLEFFDLEYSIIDLNQPTKARVNDVIPVEKNHKNQ